MTDRDAFAAAVLPAVLICNCQTPDALGHFTEAANKAGRTVAQQVAHVAYEIADAMVKQRGPEGEPSVTHLRRPS